MRISALLVLFCVKIIYALTETEAYGPYSTECTEVNVVNSTAPEVSLDVQLDSSQGRKSVLSINITYHTTVTVDTIKLDITRRQKDRTYAQVLRRIMKKPCTNPLFNALGIYFPLFKERFSYSMSKKTCVLKKHAAAFKLDLMDIFRVYLGPQFYYGDYIMQLNVQSVKKVLYKLMLYIKFTPN